MSANCDQCPEHSGFRENIRELCTFKQKMTASDTGTIDRIWTAMDKIKDIAEKKISKGMIVLFIVALISLFGFLFGLVYHSNIEILHEMSKIRTDVALIKEAIK